MTPPHPEQSRRGLGRLLWWALGLLVAAVLTGVVGGYGLALLHQPATADAVVWQPPDAAPALPPAAAPGENACVRAFDVYSAMHHAYANGVDFSESRLTAAGQLRELANQYPEPDRTHLIEFSDVLAADAEISSDDREAVSAAVDREGDAWLDFIDDAC